MWGTTAYHAADPVALEAAGVAASNDLSLETVRGLTTVERMAVLSGATAVLATAVLGIFGNYGRRAVETTRRSPIISVCVGVPMLLLAGVLTGAGYLVVGTPLGTFVGLLLLAVGTTVVPTLTVLGYVAIGTVVASRLGADRVWLGVVVGSLLAGAAAASVPVALGATCVAACLGVGAGVRTLTGRGATGRPEERRVPPANRI